MAADDGYLRNLEDKRGKPGRWVIGDPLPESVDLLPDPAQLATADTTPDLSGCAVALESEGERDDERNKDSAFSPGQCDVCGAELIRSESVGRGRCAECHLIAGGAR